MTTVEKIKVISERIRKNIPRTMELREGCLIELSGEMFKVIHIMENYPEHIFLVSLKDKGVYSGRFTYPIDGVGSFASNPYKVIGHEIMINDVLEWLSLYGYCCITSYGDLMGLVQGRAGFKEFKHIGIDVNLSKSLLKDQPAEFIDFLYQIFNK